MKYESCQEIVKGKDYTRDEPLCDNTTLPGPVPASSRYREEAREEKGGNPQFLLNIQTLRIKVISTDVSACRVTIGNVK